MNGTGMSGAEARRLENSTDERIKDRIYFYVDAGKGIRPEAGVGHNAHAVRLNDLYDLNEDTLLVRQKFPGDPNKWESEILDSGFTGYIADFGEQRAVVLLGEHKVPVKFIGYGSRPSQEMEFPIEKTAAFRAWFGNSIFGQPNAAQGPVPPHSVMDWLGVAAAEQDSYWKGLSVSEQEALTDRYRAREELPGGVRVLYHATQNSFSAFKVGADGFGVHFGTLQAAQDRVDQASVVRGTGGTNVMPIYARLENPVRMTDMGMWGAIENANDLYLRGILSDTQRALVHDKVITADSRAANELLVQLLQMKGYDGVVYTNMVEDVGQDSHIVFDPKQLKSAVGNVGSFLDFNHLLLQQARGSFDPNTRTIALLEAADLSTFFHEAAHYFLDIQSDIASQDGAPARVVEDLDRLLQWFKVDGDTPEARLSNWNAQRDALNAGIRGEANDSALAAKATASHEQMAESFEQYLREGKAPSVELQGIFNNLRAWLKWVYKTLTDMYRTTNDPKMQLNDEVRQVFDRLIATDEQILLARSGEGMVQLFGSREEAEKFGLDWQRYHESTVNDVRAAQEELSARAIRDMKWLDNAKSRLLKKMQKEGAAARKVVREEVAAQVMSEPIYQAQRFLRTGKMRTPDGEEIQVEQGYRLNTEALKSMYPDSGLDNPELESLKGMTSKEGLPPDLVAEMFGIESGDKLVRDLIALPPVGETVEAITDQRMIERHAELADPQLMQDAVNRAIHNEAHARVVATELAAIERALSGTTRTGTDKNGRPVARRTLPAAAERFAAELIGRTPIGKLKPAQFQAAAARASRAATKAMKEGNLEATAEAKRNELINNYAARAASAALDRAREDAAFFRRIVTTADTRIMKDRDMDLVYAARAVLAQFGFKGKAQKAEAYLELVKQNDPQTYSVIEPMVRASQQNAKPFAALTVEEVKALRDEIDGMWFLAKRMRQIEINGDKLDRAEVAAQLAARLEAVGVPAKAPGEDSAVTPSEERAMKLATLGAALTRVEAWVTRMDGSETMGVFRKYVWNPIKEAADRYRADKVTYVRAFRDAFDKIAPTLRKGSLAAPELGYTFGKDSGGVAMNELLHAMLHTGNESNKRKLLLGRGWAAELEDGTLDTSGWDAFIDRMHQEGVLRAEHYEFLQSVWDLLEKMKPGAQAAHREAHGKYFAEVTADAVQTPFGIFRGGYVPAMVDARIVKDMELKRLIEEGNESLTFAFPGTSKGFTQSRVEYNRPLLLDLRTLPQHMDKVLKFTHLENPVRDAAKLLATPDVADRLNRMQPAAINGLLRPWLTRAASQQVTTPVVGAAWANGLLNTLRNRTSMATMFANVSNSMQQITGFALAAVKVRPGLLLNATGQYLANPKLITDTVADSSTYMANRMRNEVEALMGEVDSILLNPSVYENAQRWAKRHQFFLQSAVDNVMGPIIWTAAQNQALEEGLSVKDAMRFADATIRQTQGSTLPEDVSRIETGPAFVRLFTQFSGYFNMQANLLGAEFARIPQELGLGAKIGRGLYIGALGFAVPAMVAEAIAQGFRGGPDDDERDGEYLDDWIMATVVYGPLRNLAAFAPGVGQLLNSTIARFNKNPVDDKLSVGAAVGTLESVAAVPNDLYKAAVGEGNARKTVRDVATLTTLLTGLPVSAVARPAGYAAGVADGRVQPKGAADAARGLISGAPSPESRTRQ